ncbi:hypothetical protein Acr_14g0005580 [Actinidia rufa]|uniref:Uncharacterized protein n=1 Tax=Actinidia rufa TaxID=165716 RepID=A0A7J0FQC5_9ERIC|nr:hypothetical protein Acr_14g0005580 [Actinidia rufa]
MDLTISKRVRLGCDCATGALSSHRLVAALLWLVAPAAVAALPDAATVPAVATRS